MNNIFAQIGLIMLIGLAAKNAILIVEFAKMLHEQGKDVATAALESARLRFRPILMTAFAFILGVVPLLTATGAGAEARKVMGMTVFSGMLIATILGVLLVPVLFTLVGKLTGSKPGHAPAPAPPRRAAGRRRPLMNTRHLFRRCAASRRPSLALAVLAGGCAARSELRAAGAGAAGPVPRRRAPAPTPSRWPTCPGGRCSTTRRCRR